MQQANRHINVTILITVVVVSFWGCSTSKKLTHSNYHLVKTPHNTVRIYENFYCDRTEMDNLGWREYMFWTKRVFGVNTIEYISTLPDTLVWTQDFKCLDSLVQHYLRNPAYANFPIVGITQQQAVSFSTWRSDRVFEKLLVDLKKIEWDSSQNVESYFSIKRYYNGTITKIIPGEKVRCYPHYRIPTPTERNTILNYADSVDLAYFATCNTKYCKDCKSDFPKFHSDITPCVENTFQEPPTVTNYSHCGSKKGHTIYNLRGNVAEWTSEYNIAAGGS